MSLKVDDSVLNVLALCAGNIADSLCVLPEVESGDRCDALSAHEFARFGGEVAHDLDEDDVLVLLAHLLEDRGYHLAGAAPRGGIVDDDQGVVRGAQDLVHVRRAVRFDY